jgi:hypothetical protein
MGCAGISAGRAGFGHVQCDSGCHVIRVVQANWHCGVEVRSHLFAYLPACLTRAGATDEVVKEVFGWFAHAMMLQRVRNAVWTAVSGSCSGQQQS